MMARQKTQKSLSAETGQSPTLRSALAQLLEAHCLARSSCQPDEEYAVEFHALILGGSSPSAMRWLVLNNFALHLVAGKQLNAGVGEARRVEFSDRSRFTLTEQGLELARATPVDHISPVCPVTSGRPRWSDSDLALSFRGLVVLRVSARARNQICVLNTFQEDRWCRRILDPLPGGHPDPKKRLANVVYHLNNGLIEPLMWFRADGD